ncbi:MAG TPA: AAA family ATPase, partial [Methanomassiliicoccales archaeon]|nr:AAA family ATPase [Methanomassiliicoccales archaeon]
MSNAERLFEESTTYALSTELKDRDIDLNALVRWSDLKVVALTGVRRSGKSSLLMLLAQHLRTTGRKVAYINAEDSRLARDTLLEDALKWFGDSGYLIVDEITSAVDWSGWLARNHDLLKGRLRIIVSSSRSGLVEPPKELRGRVRAIEISPLS